MGLSNVDQVIFKEEQPLVRIERTIPREVVHEVLSPRWEVAVIASPSNSIRYVWYGHTSVTVGYLSCPSGVSWTLLKVAWTY